MVLLLIVYVVGGLLTVFLGNLAAGYLADSIDLKRDILVFFVWPIAWVGFVGDYIGGKLR